jgi:hypothetical protein
MSDDRTLNIPRMGDATTAGSSFDAELAPVMWARTRLIFLVGLAASGVFFVINTWYGLASAVSVPPLLKSAVHALHPISFIAGLVIVHVGERTLKKVQATAFLTIALNLLLLIPGIAIFYPQKDAFLPLGLMLFTTAAFLPCRQAQVWLAAEAAVLSVLMELAAPALFPEVAAYWQSLAPRDAFFEHLWRPLGATMIAGVSVLVSRSLYRLQRTAHQARRLGNYVIERELGAGGMGTVFAARHALICRPTAVKVLSADGGDPGTGIARFEREVQLSASLTHPNTITIFDFGRTADDTFYYAMEYLDGIDLEQMVEDHGPLPPERTVYLLRQILGSLAEAHQRGIVHRDVKPSNIFVTQRGGLYDFVKVLDFGLARQVDTGGEASLTKTGMVFGTPRYIAPESVSGARQSDGRSDLYNVGGVAYWLLTGRPLFPGSSSLDLIIDHVKTIPQPPSSVTDLEIPPELDAIVMKCLEKDPADRYQTAEEMMEALQALDLGTRWSQGQAREWWELHAPEVSRSSGHAPVGKSGNRRPVGTGEPATA